MAGRALTGAVAVAFVLALAGCGSSSELRGAGQAGDFIVDAVRGSADDWDIAAGAGVRAESAWLHKDTIENIGAQLKENGIEWACDTAESADLAADVSSALGELTVTPEERIEIIVQAGEDEQTRDEANSLIDEVLRLTPFEAAEVIDAACGI